jgi:hypothetical protein
MVGATVGGCSTSGTITTCVLNRENGYTGLMVWDTTKLTSCVGQLSSEACGSTVYNVPSGYPTKRDLDGIKQASQTAEYVGEKPLLFENQ